MKSWKEFSIDVLYKNVSKLNVWPIGHVRREKDKLVYKVLINEPKVYKPRGRPYLAGCQHWFDSINKDLKNLITTRIEDADNWGVKRGLMDEAKQTIITYKRRKK